ncbi:MAG: diguanylate cyclase/phosphodiesterase [Actinomycetia bacterium]|nr:diguanylate cyclase/phosphodiesterase [Actinomycetes bacterium]
MKMWVVAAMAAEQTDFVNGLRPTVVVAYAQSRFATRDGCSRWTARRRYSGAERVIDTDAIRVNLHVGQADELLWRPLPCCAGIWCISLCWSCRSGSRVLVKSIIDLARSLGLDVVAEGVERTAQAEILHDLGCPKLQGYLYARPMGRNECSAYLTANAEPLPADDIARHPSVDAAEPI